MQLGLDLACAQLGWPLGRVLTLDPDTEGGLATEFWNDEDSVRHRRFLEALGLTGFATGLGLAQRVVADGRVSAVDLAAAGVSVDVREVALTAGLETAVGVPIFSNSGLEGVMEVMGPRLSEEGRQTFERLAQVGLRVGRMLDRDRAERQLRQGERLAQLGLWSWDVERDILLCSPELYLIHGIEPSRGVDGDYRALPSARRPWMGTLSAEDQATGTALVERLLRTGQSDEFEYRLEHGRSIRWLRARAEVANRRGDTVTRLVGYTQDVTGRKRTEERRRRVQRALSHQQRVLERIALGEPLSRTLDGLCRYVERQYPPARCTVLLVDRAAGVLRHGACPSLPRDYGEVIDGLPVGEGMAACGTAPARGEIVVVADVLSDPLTAMFVDVGRRFNLGSVWSHPLRKADGEVLGTFAVYRARPHKPSRSEILAVTNVGHLAALAIERSRVEAALQAAANFDSVTGLPNRARFLELVNDHLQNSRREAALMLVEVDRFKQINDSLGRLAGERILVEVADRLRAVVGDNGLVSRFGTDEFTVMVPGVGEDQAKGIADQMLESIETPITLDGGEFFMTVSVGIAARRGVTDAYGLVRDADAAMNAARAAGPGRQQMYDRRLRARLIDRLNRETELRHAIEHKELVMHYQPIFGLADRRWTGVEALVRWQHPDRGLIGPDEFIPLAEATGLIVPLGANILELVTEQASAWSRSLPEIHIAFNASVLQLAHPTFAPQLNATLERAGLTPHAVLVEVTESALMQELDTTRATLARWTSSGVLVLIDDFGTGYSSLARLGELPITGLKIDRRFTSGLGTDPNVRPVMQAITELGRAYGLQVVAEGIEDDRSLRAVDELGCDYAQGFHLGRPADASVIETQLAAPLPHHIRLPVRRRPLRRAFEKRPH